MIFKPELHLSQLLALQREFIDCFLSVFILLPREGGHLFDVECALRYVRDRMVQSRRAPLKHEALNNELSKNRMIQQRFHNVYKAGKKLGHDASFSMKRSRQSRNNTIQCDKCVIEVRPFYDPQDVRAEGGNRPSLRAPAKILILHPLHCVEFRLTL